MEFLPLDVSRDIFSRLSVKEVCRLHGVSRDCLNAVSNEFFKKLHVSRSERRPKLVIANLEEDEAAVNDEENESYFLHLASANLEEGTLEYEITEPVVGYVEMLPSGVSVVCFANDKKFYMFNPISREFKTLPDIASTTSIVTTGYGFGYVPSGNEFIFAHIYDISREEGAYDLRCEILTLPGNGNRVNDDSLYWREIEQNCPFIVSDNGILVQNKFYWRIMDNCEHSPSEIILSLDLTTESFQVVSHPDIISQVERKILYLTQILGDVCLMDMFLVRPDSCFFDIWLLKDPGNHVWSKAFTVDLLSLPGFDIDHSGIALVGYLDGELIIHDTEKLWLDHYNPNSRTFRRRQSLNLQRDSKLCLYVESLLSLDTGRDL